MVLVKQHEQPERQRVALRAQQLSDRHKVLERLGHLAAGDVQVPQVDLQPQR